MLGADNQQGSPLTGHGHDPSETTCRAPLRKKEVRAYLQGALHDASRNKQKRIRFTQKGTEWLCVLHDLFNFLGYNSWLYKEGKNRKVYALETTAQFLDFNAEIKDFTSSRERICYIRGFFDAEGGIPKSSKNRFYIQLVQKDYEKIHILKSVLEELDIHTGVIHNPSKRVDPEYWRIFISARSYRRFSKVIGSWHPRKQRILKERMKI